MSNETIIALLQNQTADLESQLAQLIVRAQSLSQTINSLKCELENVTSMQANLTQQAYTATALAQSALTNAQNATNSMAQQREELNQFIAHTAMQIEALATKAQQASNNISLRQSTPEQEQIDQDIQAAHIAMVEQDANDEDAYNEIVPEPIAEQPQTDSEKNEITQDLQKAQEKIAEDQPLEPEPEPQPTTAPIEIEEVEEEEQQEEYEEEEEEQEEEDEDDSEDSEEENGQENSNEPQEPAAPINKPTAPEPSDQTSIIPKISDIKAGISIGDRFLYQRQLFKNSGELMNKTIAKLNEMSSYDEAMAYCEKNFNWDKESNAYELFTNVLRRRF